MRRQKRVVGEEKEFFESKRKEESKEKEIE